MNNLAGTVGREAVQKKLSAQLFDHLTKTQNPRVIGGTVGWDHYPYYGTISTQGWAVDPKPSGSR